MATHAEVAAFAEQKGLNSLEPSIYTPLINPDYVFRQDLVIEMIGFFKMSRAKAMWLSGLQGSGKTTLVEQFHAAQGWPLITYAANAQTTAKDLLGGYRPAAGEWQYRDGPVTVAARHGCSILIDEYNLIEPEETSGINKFLDGQHMDIEETGERITPVEGFKLFAACNPADTSRGFFGRKEQDAANTSRFWMVDVLYAEPEVESALVAKILAAAIDQAEAKSMADQMVNVANRVRQQSMCSSNAEGALEITFPTRSLLLWAEGVCVFGEAPNPVHFALERALTRQSKPDTGTKDAIHQIVADIFGIKP